MSSTSCGIFLLIVGKWLMYNDIILGNVPLSSYCYLATIEGGASGIHDSLLRPRYVNIISITLLYLTMSYRAAACLLSITNVRGSQCLPYSHFNTTIHCTIVVHLVCSIYLIFYLSIY